MLDTETGSDDDIELAWGSCYGMKTHTSDIFETISRNRPDVFVWLGDVAYTDHPLHFAPMGVDYIQERLDQTRNALGYSKLAEGTKIVGVWDDHDFGTNDGGRHFPHKQ